MYKSGTNIVSDRSPHRNMRLRKGLESDELMVVCWGFALEDRRFGVRCGIGNILGRSVGIWNGTHGFNGSFRRGKIIVVFIGKVNKFDRHTRYWINFREI